MITARFAILGTAKIAKTIAPRIHACAHTELAGVASRTQQTADAFAAEFDIPKTYDSYQAALDDPDVDAVYIPLPPSLHLEWTSKAAAAGKHVLCEKPMARNAAEVEQMTAVCQRHGVVLLDGVMWYHTPRNAAIRKLVASGELGDLQQLNSVFTFCWDDVPMENLRMHRELGGGSLLDLGWYCIGAALMLFDEMPLEVFARATWQNDVDTRLNGFLWFPGQKVATIACGFHTVRRRWLEVAGSRQTLFCDDFTRPWNADKPSFRTLDNDGVQKDYLVPHKPQEECMLEAFCELIRDRKYEHSLLNLAHNTQRVCDAADKSARDEKPVRLG
jgi:predicted dehydrogenase